METPPKTQPRQLADFYYDYAALVTLLGLLLTGLVLWPVLGFGPAAAKYYAGLHRQQWINLHLAFALAFGLVCLIHVVRHWRWVKLMTPRHLSLSFGLRGVATLLATTLLTAAVIWSSYTVLEKHRLNPVPRGAGLVSNAAVAQDTAPRTAAQPGLDEAGPYQAKGRARRRGGRGGF